MDKNLKSEKNYSEEKALIAKAKNNDALAFVQLLGRYSSCITSTAETLGLPRSEFEDLCQEGRLALYRAVMSYDENIAKFSTYAGACIKNSMISWAKKASRESLGASDERELSERQRENELVSDVSVKDEAVVSGLLGDILFSNAAGLSEYEKRAIGLKLSGQKVKRISEVLGKDQKSVENTLFRARAKIRKYLGL